MMRKRNWIVVAVGLICMMLLCSATGGNGSGSVQAASASRRELTEDELGKPFAAGLEGLETLFSDDFSGDDWTQGGKAVSSKPEQVQIVDGKLLFPAEGGVHVDSNCAYGINVGTDLEYQQIELSFEYTRTTTGGHEGQPWFGLMIGCYVTNTPHICDNAEDGMWLGLSDKAQVTLYGVTSATSGGWAVGAGAIPTPKGFGAPQYVKVVVTKDYRVCVWVADSADGEYVLYADVQATEDQILGRDGQGTQVVAIGNDRATNIKGDNFVLWTHCSGTTLDNVQVRMYGLPTQEPPTEAPTEAPTDVPSTVEPTVPPTATGDANGAVTALAAAVVLLAAGTCIVLVTKKNKA